MRSVFIVLFLLLSHSLWANETIEGLEDCGLLQEAQLNVIKDLKICKYQLATKNSHISGTVCSYTKKGENKISIYAKTPGWMNFINDNHLSIQQCLKTTYTAAGIFRRQHCKAKELYDVYFIQSGEKLRMRYSIGREWSFKTPETKTASLKCVSVSNY